jgi:choline-sulfatase
VSQVDLLPTVLDFCGIDDGELKIEGRSVRPVIDDVAASWRDTVYCEIHQKWLLKEQVQSSMVKMLRRGPWKYIYTLVDGHIVEEELYNLEDDPDELINLAVRSEHTELLKEFRDELLRWYVATEVNRLHPVPENHYAVPQVDRRWM